MRLVTHNMLVCNVKVRPEPKLERAGGSRQLLNLVLTVLVRSPDPHAAVAGVRGNRQPYVGGRAELPAQGARSQASQRAAPLREESTCDTRRGRRALSARGRRPAAGRHAAGSVPGNVYLD